MSLIPRVFNYFGRNVSGKSLSLAFVQRTMSTEAASEITEYAANDKELANAVLEAKRNKSRLRPRHYKLIHGEMHVDPANPYFPYEETIKFRRKLLAKHGQEATGIDLGIAWPTPKELDALLELERVSHPYTIQEVVDKKRKLRQEASQKLADREKEIELKVSKLAGWIKELEQRKAKKIAAAQAAQEKKDRLIEEVRQHFGYVVSMKDAKFQEMLEKKEKEARKAEKEIKKKEKQDKTAAVASSAPQSTDS